MERIKNMRTVKYSTLVIGSGIAGLYAAIKIVQRKDFQGKLLIVTKCPLGESNSRYAQGGIAGVISKNLKDGVSLHISDTIKSGAGLSNPNVVEYVAANSERVINDLDSMGAEFDKDENGDYLYALGGGHSVNRVLHAGEDSTGMVIINALVQFVKNSPKIDIMPKSMAVELLISNNGCKGAIVFDKDLKEYTSVYSDSVVLASGGIGQVYKYTTNPYGATGDGVALAYMAGAKLKDIEFIQFHPTALVLNKETKNRYLISEAVRGEGGKLLNNSGEEFMSKYSDKKELSSRDIVTRAIISEMEKEQSSNVYLKLSDINSDIILKRFPSIWKKCKTNGIDITKDLIPVAHAAHYMIGGVEAQLNGKTSIDDLYVIGELASTEFHGANRLASNSLLECVVSADKLAQDIPLKSENIEIQSDNEIESIIEKYSKTEIQDDTNYHELKNQLRELMWNNVGIIRNEKALTEAKNKIERLLQDCKNKVIYTDFNGYEYRNMLIASNLITECALRRKESRGAHYRSDYPYTKEEAIHTYIRKGE